MSWIRFRRSRRVAWDAARECIGSKPPVLEPGVAYAPACVGLAPWAATAHAEYGCGPARCACGALKCVVGRATHFFVQVSDGLLRRKASRARDRAERTRASRCRGLFAQGHTSEAQALSAGAHAEEEKGLRTPKDPFGDRQALARKPL